MRILSQDGMIDVPYNTTSLSIWDNHDSEFCKFRIYAHMRNQNGSPCILAIYSTEAKAKRSMEMLREKYLETNQWCSEVAYGENNYPKVFQFPSDDEIEA